MQKKHNLSITKWHFHRVVSHYSQPFLPPIHLVGDFGEQHVRNVMGCPPERSVMPCCPNERPLLLRKSSNSSWGFLGLPPYALFPKFKHESETTRTLLSPCRSIIPLIVPKLTDCALSPAPEREVTMLPRPGAKWVTIWAALFQTPGVGHPCSSAACAG